MRILARRMAIAVAFSLALSASDFLVSSCTYGSTVYWDTNGTVFGCGNSGGSWSGSYWNTDSVGGSGGTISTWTSGSDAIFSAGTDGVGGLTISVTGTPVVANLTVNYGNITLSGTSSFALSSSATWTANAGTSLVVQPNVNTASLFTVGGAANTTFAGVIGGFASLVKTGSGIVTLQAANPLTGTTTITGGTLDLANGNSLQLSTFSASTSGSLVFDHAVSNRTFNFGGLSGAGNLVLQNNAGTAAAITLSVGGNTGSTTYSGNLSGSGSLTKIGIGSLTLLGTNTYSGGTTISGGTLQMGNGVSGYDGVLPAGITNNAALVYNIAGNQTYSGALGGVGNLVMEGNGMLTLANSTTLSGNTTVTAGTLNLSNSAALQLSTLVAPTSGTLVFNKSVTGNAFVVGNLSGSGNIALQNSATTAAPISLTVGGNNTTTEYFGVLSGAGSLTVAGNGTLILANTSTFTGGTTVAGGILQFGDGASGHDGLVSNSGGIINNGAVNFNLFGPASYGGNISGSGSLTMMGTNLLTLTGSNPFTGGTTISAGTLQLGDGTSGHDCVFSSSGGITNNSWLVSNVASLQTIGQSISGGGTLSKIGSGNLTLTAANLYTGSTLISAGTLQLGDGTPGDDGSLSGTGGVLNNSVFAFNLSGSQNFGETISGSGLLAKLGTGSLTLSATNNSYGGGTTISGGMLEVTNTGALPGYTSSMLSVGASGTLTVLAGTAGWTATNIGSLVASNSGGFASGSALGIDTTNTTGGFTYAGVIPGSMGFVKAGPNALVLTASNTFSGITTISGGTLQVGTGQSGQDGTISAAGVQDGGTLAFDLYGTKSYAGAISGMGGLTKTGTGTLVLQGSNTFSGAASVLAGTLDLANSAALGQSTLVAPTSGTLAFDSSVSNHVFYLGELSGSGNLALQNNAGTPVAITLNVGGNQSNSLYDGVLSGPGSLVKSGSGQLTLTGTNSFTGGTTISGGILQLGIGVSGRDGVLVSSGSIADNGILSFDLFASQTYSGEISGSGSILVAAGSLTLAPAASLVTTAGSMHVGQNAGATLNVLGGTVSLAGELDVNYQATNTGSTGILNLQGGSLGVGGPVTVGHARMDTSSTDTCALVNQTGGTLTAGGLITIGLSGQAQSIYDASGGRLAASDGLAVGAQGNGALNISAGNVAVTGTVSIGGDPTWATGGTVNLSSGTLSISGDTTLGNVGIGTLVRSGGVMSAGGNLVADGDGTLVLNGSASSVATHFSGQLKDTNYGTLVIVPYNGLLTGNEALSFGQSSALTDGIVGPWAVVQNSGTNTSADYATLNASGGTYSVGVASYTSTNFTSSSGTSVVTVTGSPTLSSASAYAVKFANTVTSVNGSLALGSGGMIVNGGTLSGSGSVSFGGQPGMIFAGTSTASAIAASLNTDRGLTKFGPGSLILSGNNSATLSGDINVASGVLTVQSSGALGLGGTSSGVFVAGGAALEIQGNIALPGVPVSIGGSGIAGDGALRNVQDNNSLAGVLNLINNAQLSTDSGTLTLQGPIQGGYNLTKTGTGTLALTADSSFGFTGGISVLAGTLDVSNTGALGTVVGGGITTIGNSATLLLQNNVTVPQSLAISGSGLAGGGALRNPQGDNGISGSIQLAGNSQITTDTGSLTLSGPVFGNYGLTKTGSGALVLSAANSFGGPLTIAAGTLSITSMNNAGSAGPLGSGTSAVTFGSSGGTATLDYQGFGDTSNRAVAFAAGGTGIVQIDDPGANLTLNGAISGSGSLVLNGYGTLTLGGTSSFSGPVFVTQGVLAINPSGSLANASTISVSSAGLLQLTNSGSPQLSSSAAIALYGSQLIFTGNAAASGGAVVGPLTLGVGENDISIGVSTTGSYQPYLKFASTTPHTIGSTVVFSASGALAEMQSASLTNGIIGGYAFYNGTDFATVSGGTVGALSLYTTGNFGSLAAASTMNVEPTGLQTSQTNAVTINSLNLGGSTGVQMTSSGALTLASGGLIANTTGGIRGGTLKGSASGELTVYLAQDITISSAILDNGGPTALVISGPGTLTLTGSTSYTGATYLNNGALTLIPPVDTTYAGVIQGPGSLTKSGTATLTLTGTSDYSGATTITGGALRVNGSLSADTDLTLQSSALLTGSGTVGGDVTVTGGTIAMPSVGSIEGSVTVDSGTLAIGKSGTGSYLTPLGGLYVTGGGVLVSGAGTSGIIVGNVAYSSSANSSYTGVIVGSGSTLDLNSPAGTALVLAASNSYGGGTSIEGGTLKLANSSALGSGGLTISGGTLDVGGLGSVRITALGGSGGTVESSSGASTLVVEGGDFSGSIVNGAGQISLSVPEGTLTLSGTNTFSGGTNVSDGILIIANPNGLLSASSLTVGTDTGAFSSIIPAGAFASPSDGSPASSASAIPEPATVVIVLAAGLVLSLVSLRRRIGGTRHG
jgi:fibronectin-binding autotransporter adhesin